MILLASDVKLLQQAYEMLEAGDADGARALLATLPDVKLEHPDVVHLLALIMSATGELAEARDFLEYAVQKAPKSFSIWQSYGNLLGDLEAFDEAYAAYEKAAAIDPKSPDPHLNLGLTATRAGQFERAHTAFVRAEALASDNAAIKIAHGLLEQQRGETDAAVRHFHRALEIAPRDVRARHNMGVALRAIDEPQAALEQIELAIALGSMAPESFTIRAHLLAELGRFEDAVGQYHEVVKSVPDHLDAHETLSSLLPQLGVADVALESYRRALSVRRDSLPLWQSALSSAKNVGDDAQLIAWASEAEAVFGERPEFTLAKATAFNRSGNPDGALSLLLPLVERAPAIAAVQSHISHTLLKLGEPARAEAYALRATEIDPVDQFGWSHLTIIWRLLNDPREAWLADYDRLVMTVDVVDQHDRSSWLDALRDRTERLHIMSAHPAEQSLRGGTQTRGDIFDRRNPDMRTFAAQIRKAVEANIAQLPADHTHPFLSRNSQKIKFSGSWSVRLASSGYHTNHIHQKGWLSSAFYVSLPPEVGGNDAGALTFGVPDAELGLALTPRRVVRPRAGQLIIFPSYFWHGTLPFESQSTRLTMAFDAVPA